MDFCKRMMIQRPTRLCSAPIILVSLDLWILAHLPWHTLGQICQFIWNLPSTLAHITSLCMQIGTVDVVKRSIQCKASSASRRNYLAIQIGGFLRRFAQRSVETSGRFWSNPGRRVFLARKSYNHATVNLCGSSILVKDREIRIPVIMTSSIARHMIWYGLTLADLSSPRFKVLDSQRGFTKARTDLE